MDDLRHLAAYGLRCGSGLYAEFAGWGGGAGLKPRAGEGFQFVAECVSKAPAIGGGEVPQHEFFDVYFK